jgi:hypothetical protein
MTRIMNGRQTAGDLFNWFVDPARGRGTQLGM